MKIEKRLEKLQGNMEKCEKFGELVIAQITEDTDASFFEKGNYLIEAYKKNDVDAAIVALCGWGLDSLVDLLENRESEEKAAENRTVYYRPSEKRPGKWDVLFTLYGKEYLYCRCPSTHNAQAAVKRIKKMPTVKLIGLKKIEI